jgi:sensor c-di-GMP phosphodiesterase-like protein
VPARNRRVLLRRPHKRALCRDQIERLRPSSVNSLRELKKIGISIALDDFGVGYSSLAYLTKFPFDKVKIDKSFIDALDRTETSAVISSIVELAKSLNLAIIAEGIETDEQRKCVRSLGIKFGQGFLFAEAMPLNRLIAPSRMVERRTNLCLAEYSN